MDAHGQDESAGRPGAPAPQGGLRSLPASFWTSRQITSAADASPGAVIAVVRRAYGLRQEELGVLAGFSQSTISRLESGGNLAYDMRVLRALQRLLGVPATLLGLADPTAVAAAEEELDGTNGITVPGPRSSAAFALTPELESYLVPSSTLTGPELVEQFRVARRMINDAHDWRRVETLKPAARQLYQISENMRRSSSGRTRVELLGVSASFAEYYGWLCEEFGDLRKAGQWTARALAQAQAADDRNMVAYAYTRLSTLAEAEGDDDLMVGLARAALKEDGIRPRVRAIALSQVARALARRGDELACLNTMDKAMELTEAAGPQSTGHGYVVGDWLDRQHVEVERAARLLDLRRLPEAIASYERAGDDWSGLCSWLRGVHTARLALANALRGDLEKAASLAFAAIPLARDTGSSFVLRELRQLRPWAGATPMAEFSRALNALG